MLESYIFRCINHALLFSLLPQTKVLMQCYPYKNQLYWSFWSIKQVEKGEITTITFQSWSFQHFLFAWEKCHPCYFLCRGVFDPHFNNVVMFTFKCVFHFPINAVPWSFFTNSLISLRGKVAIKNILPWMCFQKQAEIGWWWLSNTLT